MKHRVTEWTYNKLHLKTVGKRLGRKGGYNQGIAGRKKLFFKTHHIWSHSRSRSSFIFGEGQGLRLRRRLFSSLCGSGVFPDMQDIGLNKGGQTDNAFLKGCCPNRKYSCRKGISKAEGVYSASSAQEEAAT